MREPNETGVAEGKSVARLVRDIRIAEIAGRKLA